MKIKTVIKKIANKIIWTLEKDRINWCKTIFANLIFVPFKDAFKLPILIYGPCKFGRVNGQIEFKQPIRKGLLKIGISDPKRSKFNKSYISVSGKMQLDGSLILRRGISLRVTGKFIAGDNAFISDNCSINATHEIQIGEGSRAANNVTFMDTDIHFLINIQSGIIKPNRSSIIIGRNNWIGSWSTVKKGAKTPTGTIVAGPYSMISKDYTDKIPEYSVIAGSPAKLIASGMRRINNDNTERMLNKHFADTNKSEYIYNELSDLDSFCTP